MGVSGLIPARFLALTAHAVITITLLWSREDNVQACLPVQYSSDDYDDKDTQLIAGLALALCGILLEYVGFFGGLTTFMATAGIFSTCLHSAACVASAFFTWDRWDCDLYWYIFTFCSLIPATIEGIVLITVCAGRNI